MRILDFFIVALGVSALVAVRVLEETLFYDPFLGYFHDADKNEIFPVFAWGKLVLNYFFRFLLNLIFSVVIIHFIFKNKKWTVQAVALMSIFFVITLFVYLICIYTKFDIGYVFSFYMRRFVIQPLILLLIIPMFYYRKHAEKKILADKL